MKSTGEAIALVDALSDEHVQQPYEMKDLYLTGWAFRQALRQHRFGFPRSGPPGAEPPLIGCVRVLAIRCTPTLQSPAVSVSRLVSSSSVQHSRRTVALILLLGGVGFAWGLAGAMPAAGQAEKTVQRPFADAPTSSTERVRSVRVAPARRQPLAATERAQPDLTTTEAWLRPPGESGASPSRRIPRGRRFLHSLGGSLLLGSAGAGLGALLSSVTVTLPPSDDTDRRGAHSDQRRTAEFPLLAMGGWLGSWGGAMWGGQLGYVGDRPEPSGPALASLIGTTAGGVLGAFAGLFAREQTGSDSPLLIPSTFVLGASVGGAVPALAAPPIQQSRASRNASSRPRGLLACNAGACAMAPPTVEMRPDPLRTGPPLRFVHVATLRF
jgi:hypothetical protein